VDLTAIAKNEDPLRVVTFTPNKLEAPTVLLKTPDRPDNYENDFMSTQKKPRDLGEDVDAFSNMNGTVK
jgi:hypothetical protein